MRDVLPFLQEISRRTPSRIMLVVLDGLGGLPREPGGATELAAARTPQLDELARRSALGLLDPVHPGFSPGSGPGHLALFGYDPFVYQVGRGVLSALGLGLELGPGDVAVRGNFATLGRDGAIVDRRAGRPSTAQNQRVLGKLRAALADVDGVPLELHTESEHRLVLVLRGDALGDAVTDMDPQATGVAPLEARARDDADAASARTARILNEITSSAREVLRNEPALNGILLRGASRRPDFPRMQDVYGLEPAAVAGYPMYRGVAALVGMTPLEADEKAPETKIAALAANWGAHDFFYLHFKKTDSSGEDGDFEAKVAAIETFDGLLPELLRLAPEVIAITSDHSTPSVLKGHSWHPVPILLRGPGLRNDAARRFTEDEARAGSLGRFRGLELMPLLLAHAGKLRKYGA